MSSLNIHKRDKINQLFRTWPSGTVMTQRGLEQQQISRQLSHAYVKNGWIEKIGQGAFIRAGDKVDWMGGLYALQQQQGLQVHVGGRTLLDLKGVSHFIPMGSERPLFLFADQSSGTSRIPKWFITAFDASSKIRYCSRKLFQSAAGLELFEQSTFSILVASRERALMEVLALVSQQESYTHAYLLFQGKETLRAALIQELLESCSSYKVKRLFLHFAKLFGFSWLERLDLARVDLGIGKRQVDQGGSYDREYQISVPKLNVFDDPNLNLEV